jgi:hypothetical protein
MVIEISPNVNGVDVVFEGVSFARPEDEDQIYDLLLKLHEENGLFSVSPNKVRRQLKSMLDFKNGLVGIIKEDAVIQGTVGIVFDQWWYTDEFYTGELWNFVAPQYRKSKKSQLLIEFSKWIRRRCGPPLLMGIITTERLRAKERLYARHLTKIGTFFMDGIDGAPLGAEATKRALSEEDVEQLLRSYQRAATRIASLQPGSGTRITKKRREEMANAVAALAALHSKAKNGHQ